jgi:iron complex transport system substrate-binding protein
LFIYARGAGTMLVSGTGTSLDAIIRLAGAQNAVSGFSDFKPLSAESLVAADPDVILMFSSGLQSMGGIEGLLKVPGIVQTTAGKNKKIITMDGELLSGFGLRLPQAVRELHDKIAAP